MELAVALAACAVAALTIAVLVVATTGHATERADWAQERRALIDRAIARHTGEVLALDRNGSPTPAADRPDSVLVEGLT